MDRELQTRVCLARRARGACACVLPHTQDRCMFGCLLLYCAIRAVSTPAPSNKRPPGSGTPPHKLVRFWSLPTKRVLLLLQGRVHACANISLISVLIRSGLRCFSSSIGGMVDLVESMRRRRSLTTAQFEQQRSGRYTPPLRFQAPTPRARHSITGLESRHTPRLDIRSERPPRRVDTSAVFSPEEDEAPLDNHWHSHNPSAHGEMRSRTLAQNVLFSGQLPSPNPQEPLQPSHLSHRPQPPSPRPAGLPQLPVLHRATQVEAERRGGPFVPRSRMRRDRSRDGAPTPIAWQGVETTPDARHAVDPPSSSKRVARERLAELEDAKGQLTVAEYHSVRQAIIQSI